MSLNRLVAPFVLLAGCTALAGTSEAQPAAFGGPKMLIYGNYCGPGNNAPLPPIDALDAACARHDACTPLGGLPSPACNLRLQREAESLAHNPRIPDKQRAMAGMIAMGASMMPTDRDAGPTVAGLLKAVPQATPIPSDNRDDDGE